MNPDKKPGLKVLLSLYLKENIQTGSTEESLKLSQRLKATRPATAAADVESW
jgi:hypothetical protein